MTCQEDSLLDILTLLLKLSEKSVSFSEVVHFPICHKRKNRFSTCYCLELHVKSPTTEAVQFLGLIIELECQLRNRSDY